MFNPEIKTVNDIDISTKEGKLLLAAIASLSTTAYTNKTFEEIIYILNNLATGMFYKEEAL